MLCMLLPLIIVGCVQLREAGPRGPSVKQTSSVGLVQVKNNEIMATIKMWPDPSSAALHVPLVAIYFNQLGTEG